MPKPEDDKKAKPGLFTSLFRSVGWLESLPVNLTKNEADNIDKTPATTEDEVREGRLSENFQQSLAQMSDMAESDICAPVLELYAEECTQPDQAQGKAIWYECNNSDVEKKLNEMLDRIDVDSLIYGIAKGVAGVGNDYKRVLLSESEGVVGLSHIPPKKMRRWWDHNTKRLIGFSWEGEQPDRPLYPEYEQVFSPWDFIHFRRTINGEYGEGLLAPLFPIYQDLDRAMDSMVSYRLATMPNRWAVKLHCGNMDLPTQMSQVHQYTQMLRQQVAASFSSGLVKSRYNPPGIDSILVLPFRDGETTELQLMQGDHDVPDVHDIEMLSKKFYGGARVPKAYVGHGDDSGEGLAKASLVTQDMRFARMIRTLRRPLIVGFMQLAHIHLSFLGFNPKDYKVKVRMSKISAHEDEVEMTAMEHQMNIARTMVDICQVLEVPNKDILELVFSEYLHIPRKYIEIMKLSRATNQAMMGAPGAGGAPGMGGGGAPGAPVPGNGGLGVPGAMEGIDQDMAPLMEALGHVSKRAKTLIESRNGKTVEAAGWELRNRLANLANIRATGRVSLCEAFEEANHHVPFIKGKGERPYDAPPKIWNGVESLENGTGEVMTESALSNQPDAVRVVHRNRNRNS